MLVSDIILKCQRRLSMQYGAGVQVYTDDVMLEFVESAFIELFDTAFWIPYTRTVATTIASYGHLFQDMTQVRQIEDVQCIFYEGDERPLPMFPSDRNLEAMKQRSGRPYFYHGFGQDPGNLLQLLPYGEDNSNVYIQYRVMPPLPLTPSYDVLLDSLAITYGTCLTYATEDGANEDAMKLYNQLYQGRLKRVRTTRNSIRVPLDGVRRDIMTEWRQYPAT